MNAEQTEELRSLALERAVGFYVTNWPEGMANEDIVATLADGDADGDIEHWEPFEHYYSEWVAERIEMMADVEFDYFVKALEIMQA